MRSCPTATPAPCIAPDGAVGWLCVPRFDSASVFGTLLDREAGYFRFGPFGINHPTARVYEPGTNVLSTTWKTPTGWVLVRDALTMGPRQKDDVITPHTRPPADDDADQCWSAPSRCLDGAVEIELVCEPAFDYGRTPAEWTLVDGDRHTADATGAGQTIRLRTDLAVGVEGNRVRARHVLGAGDECYCALSWAEGLTAPADVTEASRQIDATTSFWRTWLGRARMPDHRWRDPIQRSALAIKGLTYLPTGATVAALTTSLPETPGGERNWDYRYTWMRDTTFTLQALHYLNLDWEADEIHPVRRRPRTQPGRRPANHVRHRRPPRPHRIHPRRPVRLCRRPTCAHRQRRLRPTPKRRLRRRPGLCPAAHPTQRPATPTALADVDTGRHLGNFPQAFSHLALIEAAARIITAERLAEFS